MKREGYIIEEIVDWRNLQDSFDSVVRGTARKQMREGRWLIEHRTEFLKQAADEIRSGRLNLLPVHRPPTEEELRNGGYHSKDINDCAKPRRIQVYAMAARIKVNAIMVVVDRHVRPRYIRTTSASIKGRGMHELMSYIAHDLRSEGSDIRYWYQGDIRKFYDTASQQEIIKAYSRLFKDKVLLSLLAQLTHALLTGISMGLRSSQTSGNVLISTNMDHIVKDMCSVRYYYRYCDDVVSGGKTKKELWKVRDTLHGCVDGLGQNIKRTERVFPVDSGLDFLGYVIYPTHTRLRKRVKKKVASQLHRIKSRKRRQELIGSLWGMAKHADCKNLMKSLLFPSEYNRIKKKMRRFCDLGITYVPKDGKKRFPNRAVQLHTLVNVEIEVLDFETEVKTKYGPRCLVMYRDLRTNETAKFFTDCDEMKQALAKAKEMDAIPFSTIIVSEQFGDRKMKYRFT